MVQEKLTEKDMIVQLKRYLSQYYVFKKKKSLLERRLVALNKDLKDPIGGSGYSPLPRAHTINEGAVSFMIRMDEIEGRILYQKENASMALLDILNVIDYLPEDSIERIIVELRHIDCLSWNEIPKQVNLSQSPVYDYYSKALHKLINYEKIRLIVYDYYEKNISQE